MRLSHNLASLNIYNEQSKVLKKQSSALERISSGYKTNRSVDDPNGIAQSERLRLHIRGAQMAARNVQDGMSMLQTAEGSLGNASEILLRIRELTIQAGNAANNDDNKKIIQNEINDMVNGIDNVVKGTVFNGVKLLSNTDVVSNDKPIMSAMPAGANVDEKIDIPMYNISSENLLGSLDLDQIGGLGSVLANVDKAIDTVNSINSKYGALENRFESGYQRLNELGDKMQAAESDIRDADVAQEMTELSKSNILIEAGNALMAQTNKFPQEILRILENVRR